jgi:hypothetical protein
VTVASRGDRAHFSGLQTCGSVWACPICSARIQAARTDELVAAVESAHRQGLRVALLTLTMRHTKRKRLAPMWRALSAAWQAAMTTDRAVQAAKAALGVVGWVRRVEATHGRNGWHLHAHALVFFDGDGSRESLDALEAAMWKGWQRRLRAHKLDADREHGLDLRVVGLESAREDIAGYLNKMTYEASGASDREVERAGRELGGSVGKVGRRGNRTPFDVLADLVANGEQSDLGIWSEWESASRGKRALTWSGGLRDRLLVDAELSDEAIADDSDGDQVDVAVLRPGTWRLLLEAGFECDLLEAVERTEGREAKYIACWAFLADRGLPEPERPPPRE